MAFLTDPFALDDLPVADRTYDLLPPGWYNATIASAEVAKTKAGSGEYIKLRYDITGPTHQGRAVFGNLNIRNPSAEAERIGRQQLGELMRAIGLARVTDTDQLVGGALSIKVAVRKSDQYGDQNDVRGFKAIGGASAPVPTAAPAPAATKAAPPWAK
jgi:hypothetical protein